MEIKTDKILEVKNLTVNFKTDKGMLHAVRGINFHLNKGETLAIVGESGSGKSVTAKSILGIEAANAVIESGSIIYEKNDLLKFSEEQFNKIRGNKITMIFQDPLSSLDPIMKIGRQLTEATILNGKTNQKIAKAKLRLLKKQLKNLEKKNQIVPESLTAEIKIQKEKSEYKVTKKMAYEKAVGIMREVGIDEPEKRFNQYPFEFSGGMRQRIVIAIAVAANPEVLICDEPTTALDVTIQAQILELINRLKKERNMSVIFITHDLGVVANVADRIAVMYAGKIVEEGTADEIFYTPKHPYTWALLSSVPSLDEKEKLESIPGCPPDMINVPAGDAFAPRNKYAMEIDFEKEPPFFTVSPTHKAATWLLHPSAPKIDFPDFSKSTAEKSESELNKTEALLKVEHLTKKFNKNKFTAVDDVSFEIFPGEVLSLVGESGCGKTTTGRAIMNLYRIDGGRIFYNDKLTNSDSKKKLSVNTDVQMIFQDPVSSLNPRMTVREIVAEGLRVQGEKNEKIISEKVENVLVKVGLRPEYANRYPHEFSGGQIQRIGIARALIMKPKLIVADEPISALDVSIKAQIINLLDDLRKETGAAILFIAHDLSIVKYFSNRIAVMCGGKIVELAPADELFKNPLHPYTKSLLSAIPYPDPHSEKNKKRIVYKKNETENFNVEKSALREVAGGHFVLCEKDGL